MRHLRAPALLLTALVLAGCGGGTAPEGLGPGGPGQPGAGQPSTTQEGATVVDSRLTVTVLDAAGATPRTWTLTCDPPGGDHPAAAAACAAIGTARTPFAPKPAGMMCTQIYGGPQTATITGTWRGEPVNASYRRTDGCEIARWNTLAAVLGSGGTGS